MALGQVELALRVAAGLFVIVAPTLLFLGLWRALEAMRDDELVQRSLQRATDDAPTPAGSSTRPVACPTCGTANRDGVNYCQQCLSRL